MESWLSRGRDPSEEAGRNPVYQDEVPANWLWTCGACEIEPGSTSAALVTIYLEYIFVHEIGLF